jgi:hypothetical protein
LSFIQGDSVLNCNSNLFNNAYSKPTNTFPFPINISDLFEKPISDTNTNLFPNNSQNISMGPGLYFIGCSINQKVYFGESENVVKRLGQHYGDLRSGKHDCKELQNDWSLHSEADFHFISLSVGQQWGDTALRQSYETKLVLLNQEKTYNQSIAGSTPKKPTDIYQKVVSYKGVMYPSIAAASRATMVSETHIRRLLRDSNNNDWKYAIDPNSLIESNIINTAKSKPVMVHGVRYRSVRDASRTTGICRRTLQRHLDSDKPENSYAQYIDL